jgi:hypothetical protein
MEVVPSLLAIAILSVACWLITDYLPFLIVGGVLSLIIFLVAHGKP